MEPITMEELVRQTKPLMDMIDVFIPILALAIGVSMGMSVVIFTSNLFIKIIQHKYALLEIDADRLLEGIEKTWGVVRKRKAQDHSYPEYHALDLGLERADESDGELIDLDEYEQEAMSK